MLVWLKLFWHKLVWMRCLWQHLTFACILAWIVQVKYFSALRVKFHIPIAQEFADQNQSVTIGPLIQRIHPDALKSDALKYKKNIVCKLMDSTAKMPEDIG